MYLPQESIALRYSGACDDEGSSCTSRPPVVLARCAVVLRYCEADDGMEEAVRAFLVGRGSSVR